MKWTADLPTVTGWYWWRIKEKAWMGIHHVQQSIDESGACYCAVTTTEGDTVEDLGGEWAGPIDPPDEA